jgi:HSP20 family molecular chaperone IbpA
MKINNHYEISPLGNTFDSLFSLLNRSVPDQNNYAHPPSGIHERVKFRNEDSNIRIEFLVPKCKKSELSIKIDHKKLSLCSNSVKKKTPSGLFDSDEINIEVFLPENLNIDHTKANLEEGVLTVMIPKTEKIKNLEIKIH